MSARTEPSEVRVPLSRERVLDAAIKLADTGGMGAVTMRKLAQELGVEAMSLYYHVANKDQLLDGMVEQIVGEINSAVEAIDAASNGDDWKHAMRRRILAAREILLQHPWAPGVIETRTSMSPVMVQYFDGLLGLFRQGGFSYDLAHHAMHALGSRALGFTQELFEPDDAETADTDMMEMFEAMADQFPHVVGMMAEISHDDPDSTLGWCDDQTEFEFGLDLLLDGLDRSLEATTDP